MPPFDLCMEAIVGGATFVARSFAGDKKQMVPLLKAALKHKGTAVLDIISPCVTFNDFDGSTKSWDWAKEHEEPLHEVGFVPRLPEIEVEQKAGQATRVQLHDGSWITLQGPAPRGAQRHRPRLGPSAPGEEPVTRDEFLTGLIYVDAKRPDFVTNQNVTDTPLALLTDESLRPSAGGAGEDHGDDLTRARGGSRTRPKPVNPLNLPDLACSLNRPQDGESP